MINKIFTSGSCRLLHSVSLNENANNDYSQCLTKNFIGKNFIGKFHTPKQHIQFVNYLKNDLLISKNELSYIFTTSNIKLLPKCKRTNHVKSKNALQEGFNDIDLFIFEICSIKEHSYNNYFLQEEFLDDKIKYTTKILSYDDFLNDLRNLAKLVNKPIIFQTHIRPNIIYDNNKLMIVNREVIYNACKQLEKEFNNVYVYDPSETIKQHGVEAMIDKNELNKNIYNHFTDYGHVKNCEKLNELIQTILS